MTTGTLASVEEYLNTSYSPDCDYVDGEVLERNLGEWNHSELQLALGSYLLGIRKNIGFYVATEQRIQITPTRFRVPDICVVLHRRPTEPVLREPPFLCVEILSPEDRASKMLKRIGDYLSFGVQYVWVIDPVTREASIYSSSGVWEAKDGVLSTSDPDILVSLPELYRSLE